MKCIELRVKPTLSARMTSTAAMWNQSDGAAVVSFVLVMMMAPCSRGYCDGGSGERVCCSRNVGGSSDGGMVDVAVIDRSRREGIVVVWDGGQRLFSRWWLCL